MQVRNKNLITREKKTFKQPEVEEEEEKIFEKADNKKLVNTGLRKVFVKCKSFNYCNYGRRVGI